MTCCSLVTGQQPYTAQLASLESRVTSTQAQLPDALIEITTPLLGDIWPITQLKTLQGMSLKALYGASDNDMCSISYITMDSIADKILQLGRGTLMAKADIMQAYRIVPVHPDDRHLLGVQWQGEILLDKVLPFGLRSAPLIFTAIADALQWITLKRGVKSVAHNLDDFITWGPPGTTDCQQNHTKLIATCEYTGNPLEVSKCEGPATTIVFLGLELDSIKLEIRLPESKLRRLLLLLKKWEGKRAGKKRDLLSLIGYLHHASKAMRQGRSFLRRLINLSMAVKPMDGFIQLNLAARSDIRWWSVYASQWNGISLMSQFDKNIQPS